MSDRTDIDARMAVTEDKEMDQKRSELREGELTGQIANQMTVTMTDKALLSQHHAKGKIKKQV